MREQVRVRRVHGVGPGRRKLWAYGYREVARFLGTSEGAVRQAVLEGRLHMDSLESLHALKLRETTRRAPRQRSTMC